MLVSSGLVFYPVEAKSTAVISPPMVEKEELEIAFALTRHPERSSSWYSWRDLQQSDGGRFVAKDI